MCVHDEQPSYRQRRAQRPPVGLLNNVGRAGADHWLDCRYQSLQSARPTATGRSDSALTAPHELSVPTLMARVRMTLELKIRRRRSSRSTARSADLVDPNTALRHSQGSLESADRAAARRSAVLLARSTTTCAQHPPRPRPSPQFTVDLDDVSAALMLDAHRIPWTNFALDADQSRLPRRSTEASNAGAERAPSLVHEATSVRLLASSWRRCHLSPQVRLLRQRVQRRSSATIATRLRPSQWSLWIQWTSAFS